MTKYALRPDGTLEPVPVAVRERIASEIESTHDDLAVWCPCSSCNRRRALEVAQTRERARQHEVAGRQSRHYARLIAALRGGISVQPIGERPDCPFR